jgi:hypothetical protein
MSHIDVVAVAVTVLGLLVGGGKSGSSETPFRGWLEDGGGSLKAEEGSKGNGAVVAIGVVAGKKVEMKVLDDELAAAGTAIAVVVET